MAAAAFPRAGRRRIDRDQLGDDHRRRRLLLPREQRARPKAPASSDNLGGLGSTTSINTETGVIVSGDNSAGIRNTNIGGTSFAINEGSITVGNGEVERASQAMTARRIDRLFTVRRHAVEQPGSRPLSAPRPMPATAAKSRPATSPRACSCPGRDCGSLDPTDSTAISVNEGIIATGDNATGMFTMGSNATTRTTRGSVTIGDLDLSEFLPDPVFARSTRWRKWVTASRRGARRWRRSSTTATSRPATAPSARPRGCTTPATATRRSCCRTRTASIITGDDSTGALVAGNYSAALVNEGRITVGDDSIGVDMSGRQRRPAPLRPDGNGRRRRAVRVELRHHRDRRQLGRCAHERRPPGRRPTRRRSWSSTRRAARVFQSALRLTARLRVEGRPIRSARLTSPTAARSAPARTRPRS